MLMLLNEKNILFELCSSFELTRWCAGLFALLHFVQFWAYFFFIARELRFSLIGFAASDYFLYCTLLHDTALFDNITLSTRV